MQRKRWAPWQQVTPPQLFIGAFAALIFLATLGFRLLPGIYTGTRLTWLDCLFMATSSVTVTGLLVADTATDFTFAGQCFILALIQIGGIGIFTYTSLIIISLGRRLSLRQHALSTSTSQVAPHVPPLHLLRDIVLFTLVFEIVGAVLLYLSWYRALGWVEAIWPSLFHSVSAFCNAGFSTFADSLVGVQDQPLPLIVIMALAVAGGIGFLTLEELYLRLKAQRQKRIFRISLHSRLVLITTAVLLAIGWLIFGILEWEHSFAHLGATDRLVNALFMSVTPRSVGFNTIDYAGATDSSNFVTILLMFIGGSPGSTTGGIKTTTVALIGLLAWSRVRGRQTVNVAGRTVPQETIQRAVGLFVAVFGVATAYIFILTTLEYGHLGYQSFLHYMFEATSAFNTVGLSKGVTGAVQPESKLAMITMMFIGRLGPLAFAAALAARTTPVRYRYAHEDIVVG